MSEVDPMVLRSVRATRAVLSATHYGDNGTLRGLAAELAGDSDALALVLGALAGCYLGLLAIVLGGDDVGDELVRSFLAASEVEVRLEAGGEGEAAA
jgi:hypothetical protein